MIARALDRIPNSVKVDAHIYVLLLVGWLAAFYAGRVSHAPVIVHTKTVAAHIGTASQVVAALGKPDSTVAGASVNSQLAGFTCGVWQTQRLLVCWG